MTFRFFAATPLAALILVVSGYIAFHAPRAFSAPPEQGPVSTPSAVTPKPGEQTYTVQAGDSFWSIAQKVYGNGNKYTLILQANNLTDKSKLRTGMVLIVPALAGTSEPAAPTGQSNTPAPAVQTPLPVLQPTAVPLLQPSAIPSVLATTAPTLPPVSVVARTQPTAPSTSSEDPGSSSPAITLSAELKNQQLLTALDILSGIFAATSLICAFLAYQSYVRAKRFEKMVIVRRRARSHPDLI